MKKNKLIFCVAALTTLLITSCSKEELLEEKNVEDLVKSEVVSTARFSRSGALYYGINGHPVNQRAYTDLRAPAQVDILKKNAMNIYRVDLPVSSVTSIVNWENRLFDITNAAKAAGINILPIIPSKTFDINHSEKEAYWQAYHYTLKFIKRYGAKFKYFELGNEFDNDCIKSRLHVGNKKTDYDIPKFRTIASYLRGMNNAVKAVYPSAKTIINVSWLHYRFLTLLDEYGVKYDIAGYHWYQDQESTLKKDYGIDDITKLLNQKLTKPIWFTEVGYRNYSGTNSEAEAKRFLDSFIAKCKNNPQVQAVMIYEMLDQPYISGQEGRFGIYKWITPYTQFTAKEYAK